MSKSNILREVIEDSDRRKKEINDFISVIKSIDDMGFYYSIGSRKRKNPYFYIKENTDVIVKSGVVIFYSHWEGLVKFSGEKFLGYLKNLNLKRTDLNKVYLDYFIKRNDKNLSLILSTIVDNNTIEIYDDMLDEMLNIDEKNLRTFFDKIGFDYNIFLNCFEKQVESITGLSKGGNFTKKIKKFKSTNHFLVEYISSEKKQININKTLENILKVDKSNPNLKSLLVLRHKIAHGYEVEVDVHRLVCLGEISIMLLNIYLEAFKTNILNNPLYT